jgi:hypothetical protein
MYTVDYHIKRVTQILRRDNLDKCCPRQQGFSNSYDLVVAARENPHQACKLCKDFVELEEYNNCPCRHYGAVKARVLTEAAIQRHYARKEGRI